jgi:hypothetical protein
MLSAMRRELETGLRSLLHGHAGGNPGHGQGAAYGLPRQFPTLPPKDLARVEKILLLGTNPLNTWTLFCAEAEQLARQLGCNVRVVVSQAKD